MCLTKLFSSIKEESPPDLYQELQNKTFDITNGAIYKRRRNSKKEKKGGNLD